MSCQPTRVGEGENTQLFDRRDGAKTRQRKTSSVSNVGLMFTLCLESRAFKIETTAHSAYGHGMSTI
jgi:hypothetical protein